MSVAGFDGFLDEKDPASQLVTVDCPWEQVTSTALNILLDLIAGKSGTGNEEICLPTKLLMGNTI